MAKRMGSQWDFERNSRLIEMKPRDETRDKTMGRNKALFLDRDGVINVDYGYVYRKEDFHFVDGIFELAATATKLGYLIVIVTNQAGIARGYYTEQQFHELMDWVEEQFRRHGAEITATYFCPYHPEHGIGKYKRDSECRKPKPGMILRAARELEIDLEKSILVGDSKSDLEAGRAAGVRKIVYLELGKHNACIFSSIIQHM